MIIDLVKIIFEYYNFVIDLDDVFDPSRNLDYEAPYEKTILTSLMLKAYVRELGCKKKLPEYTLSDFGNSLKSSLTMLLNGNKVYVSKPVYIYIYKFVKHYNIGCIYRAYYKCKGVKQIYTRDRYNIKLDYIDSAEMLKTYFD
jgi:hypothetical protein